MANNANLNDSIRGAFSRVLCSSVVIVAVAACGSDSSPGDRKPDAGSILVPAPSVITAITVDGNPVKKVRQGYGAAPTNVTTTVHVTGRALDVVTEVTVGTIPGAIRSATSTELTFTIAIPHGAPLGLLPIRISSPRGSHSFTDGMTVTPITAAPSGTDTAAAIGTDESPFRSLTKALSIAAAGDTILLKDGTYDAASGEVFPGPTPETGRTPNVPAGVTLKGESTAGTKLVGPGKGNIECTDSVARVALVLAGDARVETLDISKFCVGVYANAGTVMIQGVAAHDSGRHGFQLSGASDVTFDAVDVNSSGAAGVAIDEAVVTTFKDGHISGNGGPGINSTSTKSLTVTGTEVDHNGKPESYDAGILVRRTTLPSSITITEAKIHDNHQFGITASDPNGSAAFTVTNSTFSNRFGLYIKGSWSVKLRGSTFSAASWYYPTLVSFSGPLWSVDLGTPASRGDNTFNICSECIAINDSRSIPSWGFSAMTVTGNTWNTATPPPLGCSGQKHPDATPYNWTVQNGGTCPPEVGNVIMN